MRAGRRTGMARLVGPQHPGPAGTFIAAGTWVTGVVLILLLAKMHKAAKAAELAAGAAHTAALANQKTAEQTHEIVNSQRTDMQRYIAILEQALRAAELAVPHDKSLDE